MTIEDMISNYGYLAVGIGTFLEGETILVLGGFAAHRGFLELPWVIFSAFLGTLFGDQLFFYIGRTKGIAELEKREYLRSRSEKVFILLHKHQLWFILGFRFIYGLRTVSPFIIGASRVSPLLFLILNICGAAIWSILIGILGYLFGSTLEILLGDIRGYELLVFAILSVAGLLVWLLHLRRKTRH